MAPDPGEPALNSAAAWQTPGLSRQIVKARLHTELATVRAELNRCNAKVNTLLAVAGFVLAAGITVSSPRVPVAAAVIGWAGEILVTTAAVLLLAAIRPQLAGPFGFMRWALADNGQALLDALAGDGTTGEDVARGTELLRLSHLARAKYTAVRRAESLLRVALPAVVTAALLAAVLTALGW